MDLARLIEVLDLFLRLLERKLSFEAQHQLVAQNAALSLETECDE